MRIWQVRHSFSLAKNFAVLGLKSNAKLDEAKRKYYELAKIYHPDVNKTDNAHKKFADITMAYKYVVDNYDKDQGFTESKPQKGRSSSRTSAPPHETKGRNQKRQKTNLEQQDYQDFHEYDDFFKHSRKFRKPKLGEDIYLNLSVTLKESILGVQKEITYTRYEPCSQCAAKAFSACFSCGGKGQIYDRVNRQKARCEYCSGKGFVNECSHCLGASYILKEVKEKIYIEKGTQDKFILKVEKKGHCGYKAGNGDLFLTIFVEESDHFRVDGNNVHTDFELDFITATCGGVINIETVHGHKLITIAAGTQSGSELRIFNAGLKSPYSKRLGDHIIKIKIKIPQKLSQKQKILLQRLCELQG